MTISGRSRNGSGRIIVYENRILPNVGDANGDGLFDSRDLIQIFIAGEYEDDIQGNSVFAEGDFNGDGDFDSSDLVFVFTNGDFPRAVLQNVRTWDRFKIHRAIKSSAFGLNDEEALGSYVEMEV